jgi:hypothetical protein
MSLKNMSLLTGATYVAVTGGAAHVFSDDGVSITNGVHLIVPATADYRVRQSATAKYKPPSVDNSGVYSKDKKTISYTVPIILASGKVAFNVVRVEREVHPELSAAAAADLLLIGSQLFGDADTTNFWVAGSLS